MVGMEPWAFRGLNISPEFLRGSASHSTEVNVHMLLSVSLITDVDSVENMDMAITIVERLKALLATLQKITAEVNKMGMLVSRAIILSSRIRLKAIIYHASLVNKGSVIIGHCNFASFAEYSLIILYVFR